eukprot:gene12239-25710_t
MNCDAYYREELLNLQLPVCNVCNNPTGQHARRPGEFILCICNRTQLFNSHMNHPLIIPLSFVEIIVVFDSSGPSIIRPSARSSNYTQRFKQLQLFHDRNISITVNNVVYNHSTSTSEDDVFLNEIVKKGDLDSYNSIRNKLSLNNNNESTTLTSSLSSSSRLFFVEKLKTMKEASFQSTISALCNIDSDNNYRIMDTHSQPVGLSVMSITDDAFTFISKPDLISTALPMILEYKSSYINKSSSSRSFKDRLIVADKKAINQGLDRIWAQLSFSAALSKIIVFVTTGHFTWCMLFQRNQNVYTKLIRESIDIVSITPHQLDSLWQDITAKAVEQGQEYYLTPDGSMLYRSLNSLELPFIYCRIKYISGCKSKVYAITVPDKKQQVSSTGSTWAVKIVHDDDAFKREANALKKINCKWDPSVQKRQFYALGAWHNTNHNNRSRRRMVNWISTALTSDSERLINEIPAILKNKKRKLELLLTEKNNSCWWNTVGDITGNEGEGGGAIFMRVGQRTLNKLRFNERENPMNEVIKSLHVVHSANIFHCDIRPWNIMEFSDGWQVIDFDLCCGTNEEVELIPGTGQYEYRPYDVKMLGDGSSSFNVVWKEVYDTQMMVSSFFRSL